MKVVPYSSDTKQLENEGQKHEGGEYEEVSIFEDEQEPQDSSKMPELFLGLIQK